MVASSSPLPSNPFVAGPKIEDVRLFVGRKDALNEITSHMTGAQPVSINIVGARRIGKSSLLYHFFQTWEQRVQDTGRYIVVYLSLQDATCSSRSGFYKAVMQKLLERPRVRRSTTLSSVLQPSTYDDASFAYALKQWKQKQVLPLICLDEFEALLNYRDEFDKAFYDHLRSLMDGSLIMFAIATARPLDIYREGDPDLTSRFFNLGNVLQIRDLTDDEASDLVRLPVSIVTGVQPALSASEQHLARLWGGKHPYLLQLAGKYLCDARQQGKPVAWARGRFEAEKQRLFEPASPIPMLWKPVRWLLWSLPLRVGRVSRIVVKHSDEIRSRITGCLMLVVLCALILLGIFHWVNLPQLIGAWLKGLLGG